MDHINDGGWPHLLQVFEEGPGMAPIGIRGVNALCWEVIKPLEVSVHHNFFLVCVLERLRPWYGSFWTLRKKQAIRCCWFWETNQACLIPISKREISRNMAEEPYCIEQLNVWLSEIARWWWSFTILLHQSQHKESDNYMLIRTERI